MKSAFILLAFTASCLSVEPLQLGSSRELFVDKHLIESKIGVTMKMHKPQAHDVALVCDAPWEGNTSGYFTLLQDDDLYRCYYRGSHHGEKGGRPSQSGVTCYAESRDGIIWTKPKLGLHEFEGSKDNNITHKGDGCSTFAPFLDTNPNCPPESRYKALATTGDNVERKKNPSPQAWHSPDGLRWSVMRDKPVITAGSFDSQNTAFFDHELGAYRAYWRYFTGGYTDERGWKPAGVRAIRTATSKDFLTWENQADLAYGKDAPTVQLYTNAVRPYARAPHLLLGFPTRYQPKGSQVEPVLMTSRDGVNFKRWEEPLIPITAPKDRDWNRSNYMTIGVLSLPGKPNELSVYASEAYYQGPGSRIRRFTFRVDGFVSASSAKGELITKPLTFEGTKLTLNLLSQGETRVEVQDEAGKAIPGFALDDCTPLKGDLIDQAVTWKGGSLATLAGKSVRLRFAMQKADLFALQFVP
ncbi:MAG TPA: hypothetical protein DDZ88_19475 [Verrucomicrobiales bacterium]|nr:hypothetical protein [Verrucomicrobiales bacterium]